jgi:hypothetical protein
LLGQLVGTLVEQGQLAQVLKANYDDLEAARQGAFAATVQWPERLSDEEVRGIMEPHQATLEGAKRLERFAASLSPEQLMAIEPQFARARSPNDRRLGHRR